MANLTPEQLSKTPPLETVKAMFQKFKTDKVDNKADKTATVSNVTYDSTTGKLRQTVNGTTSDVVSVVNSGFSLTEDDTNGLDIFTAIGTATITDDNTNGLDVMAF